MRAVGAEGFPVAGVGCVPFDNLQPDKIMTDIPAEVLLTLERRNLMSEYDDLKQTLVEAQKGKLGNWKSSALAQSVHIKGHDEIFEAKNVSLFVTRKDVEVGSSIHLCVIDRVKEPTYFPPDIYTPGKSIKFVAEPKACEVHEDKCRVLRRYFRRLPEGVYGQSFRGHHVESDKVLMPVELMKFLDRKDAGGLNMEMAAWINTGERTSIDAAMVVRRFKSQFLAKGVRIFLAMSSISWQTCAPSLLGTHETCKIYSDFIEWLEYADADVVEESYKPGKGKDLEYPWKVADTYDDCMNGSTALLKENFDFYAKSKKHRSRCAKIPGGGRRGSSRFPKCKCERPEARIHCGREAVGGRKFDVDKLRSSTEACQTQGMYCSVRACLVPFRRVPMEP